MTDLVRELLSVAAWADERGTALDLGGPFYSKSNPYWRAVRACKEAAAAIATQGIEAGTAETGIPGSGRKAESPSPNGGAPEHPDATDYRNRAERAEAECKELRERWDQLLSRSTVRHKEKRVTSGDGFGWFYMALAASAMIAGLRAEIAALFVVMGLICHATSRIIKAIHHAADNGS